MTTRAQIDRFLAGHRIGIAGVSSDPKDFSRMMLRELEARGYDVVPIHPRATEIAGRAAYPHVYDVPGKLDGVLIMTPRTATAEIVQQCMTAGVDRVWMHRGVGRGAVDHASATYARSRGLDVIEGECPMMFLPDTERVHHAHAAIRHAFGHYPDDEERRDRYRAVFAIAWGIIAWSIVTLAHPIVTPFVFAAVGWMHARRPGALPAVHAAAVFVAISAVLDVLLLGHLPVLALAFGFGAAALPVLFAARRESLSVGA